MFVMLAGRETEAAEGKGPADETLWMDPRSVPKTGAFETGEGVIACGNPNAELDDRTSNVAIRCDLPFGEAILSREAPEAAGPGWASEYEVEAEPSSSRVALLNACCLPSLCERLKAKPAGKWRPNNQSGLKRKIGKIGKMTYCKGKFNIAKTST